MARRCIIPFLLLFATNMITIFRLFLISLGKYREIFLFHLLPFSPNEYILKNLNVNSGYDLNIAIAKPTLMMLHKMMNVFDLIWREKEFLANRNQFTYELCKNL